MEPTREVKARQTKEHMAKIHKGRGEGSTDNLDPDGDRNMLSDGTHKGSEGRANQRTHAKINIGEGKAVQMTWTQKETATHDHMQQRKTCGARVK
jgi:hypothetical protein